MKFLIIWRNVTKPDVPSEQDLLVPSLVKGDQVADVPVTHVRLLRQHSRYKHVVHSEDPLVTVLENLEELVPDKVTHNVDHAPAVGRKELIGPLIKGNHLKRTNEDIIGVDFKIPICLSSFLSSA